MIGISLTPEAYGEIRAKLIALEQIIRIEDMGGIEALNMSEIIFTKEEGMNNVRVYLAYEGKLLKEPKIAKQ